MDRYIKKDRDRKKAERGGGGGEGRGERKGKREEKEIERVRHKTGDRYDLKNLAAKNSLRR